MDDGDSPCWLGASSALGDDLSRPRGTNYVWLGRVDNAMHLDRETVAALASALIHWLGTGKFE